MVAHLVLLAWCVLPTTALAMARALAADMENPGLFSGVVLSAPLIIGANDNSINRVLGGLGSKLCPTCSLDLTKLDVEDVIKSEVDVEL